MARIQFIILLSVSMFLSSCYSGPKAVCRSKHINSSEELTPPKHIALQIDTAVLKAELPGRYTYIIQPGEANINFTLDAHNNYAAVYWPTNSSEKRDLGSWQFSNNTVQLKKKSMFSRWYNLQPYRIGPLLFLVPESGRKNFTSLLNKHSTQLQYVSRNYDRLRGQDVLQQLSFLRGRCLIKEKHL